jgi:hypothetical protein
VHAIALNGAASMTHRASAYIIESHSEHYVFTVLFSAVAQHQRRPIGTTPRVASPARAC